MDPRTVIEIRKLIRQFREREEEAYRKFRDTNPETTNRYVEGWIDCLKCLEGDEWIKTVRGVA